MSDHKVSLNLVLAHKRMFNTTYLSIERLLLWRLLHDGFEVNSSLYPGKSITSENTRALTSTLRLGKASGGALSSLILECIATAINN